MVAKISRENEIRILNVDEGCGPGSYMINKILTFLHINDYKITFGESVGGTVILINSCIVTDKTEERSRELIEFSLSQTAVKKIIIFGCFHYLAKEMVEDKRIIVIGPKELEKVEEFFEYRIPLRQIPIEAFDYHYIPPRQMMITEQDLYVMTCQGCAQNCSYCTIKRAKGDVLSRSIDDIVKDIQRGVKEGKRDIALIGDDCGSYGIDINTDLAVLIKEIFRRCPEVRIKINYIYPGHFLRLFSDLRESIATGRIMSMNIPIQSGSERILKLMNRNFDVDRLKKIIKVIRGLSPSLELYTHVIVNFPTETRDDFLSCLQAAVLFDDFSIFDYSERTGTPASKIVPKVDVKERKKRLDISRKLLEKRRGNLVA